MARSSAEERVKADAALTARLAKELIEVAKTKSAGDGFWFPNGIDKVNLSVSITKDGATVSIGLAGPKQDDPSTV